jgi:hypothetical protein
MRWVNEVTIRSWKGNRISSYTISSFLCDPPVSFQKLLHCSDLDQERNAPSSLKTTQLIKFYSLSHVALNKYSSARARVCVCVLVHVLSDSQLFHSILINPCYAADKVLLNEIYIYMSKLNSLQIYIKCLKPPWQLHALLDVAFSNLHFKLTKSTILSVKYKSGCIKL